MRSGAGAANGFGHSLSTEPQLAAAESEEASAVTQKTKAVQPVVQDGAPLIAAMTPAGHASNGPVDATAPQQVFTEASIPELSNSQTLVQCSSDSQLCVLVIKCKVANQQTAFTMFYSHGQQ